MPAPEIRPFTDDDLDAAAALLADRHRRHRKAEPLLPQRYEAPAATREQIEALWRSDDTSGAIALRDGRAVGYLLGIRKVDETWGPNVWVEYAGHAAEKAKDVRDLYGAAAALWVEQGRTRHYAQVPATDEALLDAWFRVGFGAQQADGIREVDAAPKDGRAGVTVRVPAPGELEVATAIVPSLQRHQNLSPVFSALEPPSEEDIAREWKEDLDNSEIGTFVADVDGRTVSLFQVCSVGLSSDLGGLARPDEASYLSYASTLPEARGTGAGVALTDAVFAWAHEHGYRTMTTDWRVTNLLSSRFWPRRGFRPTFLRLYRSIP
jgi:GNAT superfamily N-acetyltransferase